MSFNELVSIHSLQLRREKYSMPLRVGIKTQVSIHSLQLRREKLSNNSTKPTKKFSFNPLSSITKREISSSLNSSPSSLFQSTLFNYEERNPVRLLRIHYQRCFNPLSSITKREINKF